MEPTYVGCYFINGLQRSPRQADDLEFGILKFGTSLELGIGIWNFQPRNLEFGIWNLEFFFASAKKTPASAVCNSSFELLRNRSGPAENAFDFQSRPVGGDPAIAPRIIYYGSRT